MILAIIYLLGMFVTKFVVAPFDFIFINDNNKLFHRTTAIVLWPFTLSVFLCMALLWPISDLVLLVLKKIKVLWKQMITFMSI